MVIFFGLGGDSERLRAGQPGWSATEQLFTWTEGTRASLALRLPASKRPIRLAFKMAGLVDPERLPFQPVDVSVNGEKLATWEVADLRIYTLSVPKRFVAHPASFLRIDFDIPRATPPAALGQSNDERALGLCVRELRIVKPPRGAQPPPQP